MDFAGLFLILAILVVGIFLFLAILWTGKKGHIFNQEYYQVHFLEIENKLRKENPTSYCVAVIEADKLLDHALTEAGLPGKTMGERLKHCNGRIKNLNITRSAHKLRNYIAHESDSDISYIQAKNALDAYKQALKDLGAI